MARIPFVVVLLSVGLTEGSALAQNALGDGSGLQSHLEVTAPTNRGNPARRFMEEMRLRNAIVTGNVPNGLSFRGDLGYTAADEFRGELGSDDLFAFRRDSYISGLAGYGIRGTEALQYQFALTTGSYAPAGLLGGFSVSRDAWGRSLASPDIGSPSEGQALPGSNLRALTPAERDLIDMESMSLGGSLMAALRSPSAYQAGQSLTPSVIGVGNAEDGRRWGLVVSGLTGVQLTELEPRENANDAGTAPSRLDQRVTGQSVNSTLTPLETILKQMREKSAAATPPESGTPTLDEEFRLLRERMSDTSSIEEPREQDGESLPTPADIIIDPNKDERAGWQSAGIPGYPGLSQRTLDMIRESGGTVDSLIVRGDARVDPFVEHVNVAQRLLREGRYFDAEERFTRALATRPGDVAATIGRVHAQIGAGLLLSASVNLRALFASHPEVAATTYGADLLPKPERTTQIMEQLRANLSGSESALEARLGRASALVLAYLGYQTGSRPDIERGLGVLRSSELMADRALTSLLGGVWLGVPSDAGD
ncbi:MAG: hypothetical protein H6811_08315 [Phycisphaeraceae bacterium]|nr:hypothetical protein [Phycisphaeraceae bacterium]